MGGSRGPPSLPLPDARPGAGGPPRIHLWPQVRGSGCGGRGRRLGFRGAGARRREALPPGSEGRSGAGGAQAAEVPDP